MSDREDREDLAMIIAIENGDGERGPFEADYAAADAIIAAGWHAPLKHYHRPRSTECGLCGLTWPCEGTP